jgi:hypothetical protein
VEDLFPFNSCKSANTKNNRTGLNIGTRQIAKVGHEMKNRQGEELNKKKTPLIHKEG